MYFLKNAELLWKGRVRKNTEVAFTTLNSNHPQQIYCLLVLYLMFSKHIPWKQSANKLPNSTGRKLSARDTA